MRGVLRVALLEARVMADLTDPHPDPIIGRVAHARCALCDYLWVPKRWPPRRCARKRCSSPNWARGWTYEARRVQALERRKGEARDASDGD